MTRYLTEDAVLGINKLLVPTNHGVINRSGLSSATAEPEQTMFGEELHATLFNKAAALFRGVAQNHPFMDGNKRTALTAADVFLRGNGWVLQGRSDQLVKLTLAIAQNKISVETITAHIQAWSRPLSHFRECVISGAVRELEHR